MIKSRQKCNRQQAEKISSMVKWFVFPLSKIPNLAFETPMNPALVHFLLFHNIYFLL